MVRVVRAAVHRELRAVLVAELLNLPRHRLAEEVRALDRATGVGGLPAGTYGRRGGGEVLGAGVRRPQLAARPLLQPASDLTARGVRCVCEEVAGKRGVAGREPVLRRAGEVRLGAAAEREGLDA